MVNPDNTKVKFEPSEDSDYVQDAHVVPPILGPKPTKDFKKVMSKTGRQGKNDDGDVLQGVNAKDVEEEGAEIAGPMGITKKKREPKKEDDGPVSLFDLSRRTAQRDKEERDSEKQQNFVDAVNSKESPVKESYAPHEESEQAKKERFTTRYTPEQQDITYVNPLLSTSIQAPTPIQNVIPETKVEKPQPVATTMQEICAQLVKQMYTVETKGKTDTVVVLQSPSIFKDARITVTSFDSAKGQFNITFENLTQAAQLILDKEENKQLLLDNLAKRGYNVQILTTTTTNIETPILPEEPRHARDQDRREGREEEKEREREG